MHCFPSIIFFISFLKVWTERSAIPLEDGCQRAVKICFIPLLSLKRLNSLLANDGPLSVTIRNGSPCIENDCLKHCVKVAVLILFIGIISSHLE